MRVLFLALIFSLLGLVQAQDYPKAKARPATKATRSYGTQTKLGEWNSMGASLYLYHVSKGNLYKLLATDKHDVNSVMLTGKSVRLKALQRELEKAATETESLVGDQSRRMKTVTFTGGKVHIVANRSPELGPWVQLLIESSRGVDSVSYGVFDSKSYRSLSDLLGKRK